MPLLLLIYVIFLITLSGLKSSGIAVHWIHALELYLGGDKWAHFLLAVPLSLLGNLVAEAVIKVSPAKRIIIVLTVLTMALVMDELHQFFVAIRHFDWKDTLYGFGGVLTGVLLYVFVRRITKYAESISGNRTAG